MIEEIKNIVSTLEKGGRVNSHTFANLYQQVFNKKFNGAGCSSCVSDAVLRFKQFLEQKKRETEAVEHATIEVKESPVIEAEKQVEKYAKKNTKGKDK